MSVFKRYERNPVVTPDDVPYPCSRVYNPAAFEYEGRCGLLLRVDQPDGRMVLGLAWSEDGYDFRVEPKPVFEPEGEEGNCAYDPRVTRVGEEYYLCYATDTPYGIRGGIAVTNDFRSFERLHLSEPDNRNMCLFPERVGGLLARLDRPFARIYAAERAYDIWMSFSPDAEYWGRSKLVLAAEGVSWGSHKIGPGPPPVKTDRGWLTVFHGVEIPDPDMQGWKKVYRVGVMVLDAEEPWKVLGRCAAPVLEPEPGVRYENEGYRPRVVFPCGLVEDDRGGLKLYYGASDQVVAVATADKDELLALALGS